MERSIRPLFKYMYNLLCVFMTFSMTGYWAYKFILDENITVVTYRKFYERENDAYPTISMCLKDPFLDERLAQYGIHRSLYLEYLKGEYFSEEMLNISYNNVTMDISDHIKGYRILFRNGTWTKVKFRDGSNIEEKRRLTYVSYNGFHMSWGYWKCFALGIPKIQGLNWKAISDAAQDF